MELVDRQDPDTVIKSQNEHFTYQHLDIGPSRLSGGAHFMAYRSRKALSERKETLPNQVGKPIKNPTRRWLFQCLEGVAIVRMGAGKLQKSTVTNLSALRRQIVTLFSSDAQKIYGFA